MNKAEIRKIISLVIEKDEMSIADNYNLAEIGMDSIRFVQFISELEDRYGIEILDDDLLIDNFISVDITHNTLEKYVCKRTEICKCVITDCDGVLWHGIAGESGLDRAYFDEFNLDYCSFLHNLRKKGILLAICSKNEINNIHSMLKTDTTILDIEDFAIVQANSKDKVKSISEIAAELGILYENIIYIDDSDYEIGYVTSAFPEMSVYKNNPDILNQISGRFLSIPENIHIDRTAQFREQKEREKIHIHTHSPEEYNNTLESVIVCGKASVEDISRMSELSIRTNRFNTAGKQYSVEELQQILKDTHYAVYVLKASDKFGDLGLVAMAVLHDTIIENFMLSCRVFGRDFEKILLEEIKKTTSGTLRGIFELTGKNDYCKDFFKTNGVEQYV